MALGRGFTLVVVEVVVLVVVVVVVVTTTECSVNEKHNADILPSLTLATPTG